MTLKSILHHVREHHLSWVNFVALTVLAAFVVAVGAWTYALNQNPGDAAGAQGGPPAKEGREAKLLYLTLDPHGFNPAAVTRAAGLYLLIITDRSGFDDTELSLERETGERVSARRGRGERKEEWREVVRLTPGVYVLKDAKRPKWACRITITPK